jgi:hypothetical protein
MRTHLQVRWTLSILLLLGVLQTAWGLDADSLFSRVEVDGDALSVTYAEPLEGFRAALNGAEAHPVSAGDDCRLAPGAVLSLVRGLVTITVKPRLSEELKGLEVVILAPDRQGRGLLISSTAFVPAAEE